ncbi:MAG: CHAT domain-containing protein [Terracidiphilus sp.]
MKHEDNPSQQIKSSGEGHKEGLAEALENLLANASGRGAAATEKLSGFTVSRAGECPSAGDWILLASGEPQADKKEALLGHAALCSDCLARLREAQYAFSSEATPEETEELKRFSSTSPQWQHRLAVELAHTPRQAKRTRMFPSFVWLGSGLAAALVLALSVAVWWRHNNAPERLLAEAYTDARTSDLRVAGAGFAPVTPAMHLRGGGADREPAPLLNARAQIERNLEQTPSDPHWLQLEARAEMLEEHYDGAIDILDRLVSAGPVTASLLLDDGSAYFLRGIATGSENDRATALDNLRRADELAPDDPVVLFNEALMMEDRGQVMNAVETWDRFLKFERDPKWQEEGRRHLSTLEDKLDRLKSHESRMEQHLATPQSMRALAADAAALAQIDEELSTTLLPRLLDAAYPPLVDRSRGSPCADNCRAARSLLDALAVSLQHNHQDPWLQQFLPSDSSPIPAPFLLASQALGQAIDADTRGDYFAAQSASLESRDLFRKLGNAAGADRAEVERAYALQRSYTLTACHQALRGLFAGHENFPWIQAQAAGLDVGCAVDPGTASEINPLFDRAVKLAESHQYVLLGLRAADQLAEDDAESGNAESAWRRSINLLRRFYQGDYPSFRAATTMAGLSLIEDATPRAQLDFLLNKETVALFSLAPNRQILAEQRIALVRAAVRAGLLHEANEQMALAQKETALNSDGKGLRGIQAESETLLAELYLDRGDLASAEKLLDAARSHMLGEDSDFQLSRYAAARGELELARGDANGADSTLRAAILKEELEGRGAGQENITHARQNRDLYANLAGAWLAEGRPGTEIQALWERYRLRILGKPVPACDGGRLDCLKTEVEHTLDNGPFLDDRDLLIGQVVLRDRLLLFHARAHQVVWQQILIHASDLFAAAASLERVTSSPATSHASIDQASRRVGDLLLQNMLPSPSAPGTVILEPDPLLGNLPWPAVETADGSLGLRFNLEEAPSLLLEDRLSNGKGLRPSSQEKPLIVGASVASGQRQFLPEALKEARIVAGDSVRSDLLLAADATAPHVAEHLSTAPVIHFAGHAAQYEGATRLLLAPSGAPGDRPFLDAALLRRDPPRTAQLVVFSACSTGKREQGWDHGMGDIVDTLASLGVPEVVATRWQIDSASAVPMMDVFYRGLSNGLSVPQALTAARQSLIRDARYSHPYYWAAYYASGMGTTNLREVFHGSSN